MGDSANPVTFDSAPPDTLKNVFFPISLQRLERDLYARNNYCFNAVSVKTYFLISAGVCAAPARRLLTISAE